MKKITQFIWLIIVLLSFGCKKDNPEIINTPAAYTYNLKVRFEAENSPLRFDSVMYTNEAGNRFGVTALKFYLSKMSLIKADSSLVSVKDWVFIDARNSQTMELSFPSIPEGNYIGLRFNIGLDSAQNVSGGLPATLDNLSMEWPDAMGGGYHFLKMEGHFMDSANTYGYALHLGTNTTMCPVKVYGDFCTSQSCSTTYLSMNIYEWFRDPWIYDLNTDGNYTMGNMQAMMKVSHNGYNVFSLKH